MINTHDPDAVDRFVAEDYVNHNAFVADGREANRQFWTVFFAGLPDVRVTMEDLVVSGDRSSLSSTATTTVACGRDKRRTRRRTSR